MTDQEAAINHCDNIHASKGPLPAMTAKELESVFIAGCAHARSKTRAELEDLHTHEKHQLMKWRHRRDNGQLREDEWRGYDTGWADALTFVLSKLKKNAT